MTGRFSSLTVVVSTYNNPRYLLLVLEGLARQVDADFETIIADDGSRPDTAALALSYAPRLCLRYLRQADTGFRLAANRNNALALASGDLVACLDGDCIPHPFYTADARRLMARAGDGVYVQGHRVILGEAVSRSIADRGAAGVDGLFEPSWPLGHRRAIGNWQNAFRYPWWRSAHRRLRGVRGCSMIFRARDLQAQNGFDEAFVGWGHEDQDMVRRLYGAGLKRIDARGALVVYHLWHKENDRADEGENQERARSGRPLRAARGIRGGWG